jgi:hypothetical protein
LAGNRRCRRAARIAIGLAKLDGNRLVLDDS